MIYRTSQRGTYRNINNNLNLLSWHIAQLSNKVASEKQINKPSDNPSGAAAVLRTRSTLSEIAQHTENVSFSNDWLTNTGNVMQSIKDVLDQIYVKAEQAATDVYTADQRKIIATEVDLLFQTIIQFGDSRFGFNYLLAGQELQTQPFSNEMRAQDVIAACQNSEGFTGKVENYGDREYESRPDLPTQSQLFLIECVEAGGIDSLNYAHQNADSVSQAIVNGTNGAYSLTLTTTSQAYRDTTIKFVAGQENNNSTGTKSATFSSADNQVSFSSTNSTKGPIDLYYTYGNSAGTYATEAADGTITVYLQTDPQGEQSVARARDVADAVNAISAQTSIRADYASIPFRGGIVEISKDSNGQLMRTKLSINNNLSYSINDDEITIYLERGATGTGQEGTIVSTVEEVVDFINNTPELAERLKASYSYPDSALAPPPTMEPVQGPISFTPSDAYTLAYTEMTIPGTHNDIRWSILNEPGAAVGEAGNGVTIRYDFYNPPEQTAATTAQYNSAENALIITLGSSGSAFLEEYARAYTSPASATYGNAKESELVARKYAVTATAQEVIDAVAALTDAQNPLHIGGVLAEGNSGLGKMVASSAQVLAKGYDQPALFRVSQDGGKTWGPPQSFAASEFQNGLFYNSQLGHASLTTSLAGGANDVVLTANYMGTWGDDVRLEYRQPTSANQEASITLGPQSWNICINLATDAQGRVTTTANDVVALINQHPEAGALVTASLADYHEGGSGVVTKMDCVSLSTAKPYEVEGVTQITPLGHATAAVRFAYSPPAQKSPDLLYQAIEHGNAGNAIGIRYTLSADTTIYGSALQYQDHVSISYETLSNGDQVAVVHLASVSLPSCPDINTEREAYDAWRELYPVYSCSSSRATTSTAGDVLQALVAKNLASPDSALVWASMEYKDEGWDSTAKVGPTTGTIWLSGGDDTIKEEDYGISLKFIPDGTAIGVGDIYQVSVGWYNGDSKDIDVNVMNGFRTDINTTGEELLGANGASDNIMDTIQRLLWALEHNYTEMVEQELPNLEKAVQKVTMMETAVGTKLIRNQFVQNTLDDNQYAAETILSATEDADFTRLITDLKNAQLVYEAVLGTTGLTTKLSLLNYL
ncbi:MAG: hypothetical protein LBE38_02850 [Deltaproteobacteria bacterium]|nr:hypothetical protein [Deltaproteobacteria bacterium]